MGIIALRKAAVIMAGGSGTRLWPLSRANRPKQLLNIFGGRSLLREAYDRLRAALSPSDIYVIALTSHLPAIAAVLNEIPRENLIGEPIGRDTANAVALAAAVLHELDADTIMGVFTADHHIQPTDAFADNLAIAFAAANDYPDALITIGIPPIEAHTGYGYIERGEPIAPGLYRVEAFREKPDATTAANYLSSGRHYWNSGMFVWRTATILSEIKRRLPDTHQAMQRLAKIWFTPGGPAEAARIYPALTRISIDFAVMEHARRVLVVEAGFNWRDVGDWAALSRVLPADGEGNITSAVHTALLDSRNTIVVSEDDHLIATIGVDDLVIVHAAGATLVCRRDHVQKLRDLVALLDQEHPGRYT